MLLSWKKGEKIGRPRKNPWRIPRLGLGKKLEAYHWSQKQLDQCSVRWDAVGGGKEVQTEGITYTYG